MATDQANWCQSDQTDQYALTLIHGFPLVIPIVTTGPVSLFSSKGPKRLPDIYSAGCLCFSYHCFIVFSWGTTFMLPPFSFIVVRNCPSPTSIHQIGFNRALQVSSYRVDVVILWETHVCLHCSWCNFSGISSIAWFWSTRIFFSLFSLIRILICGHSLYRLIIITSVFLLFNSNPFFLLSISKVSINSPSFLYFLQLMQMHQHISNCFWCALLL